jgi:Zn-dependent protease with chaperone function
MAGMSAAQAAPDSGSLASRALLMVVLWLGFWLLAAGLVIGLLAIPVAQLHFRDTFDLSGIVAGCAGITLAYSLRPRRAESTAADVVPTPLRPDEAPQLFQFIEGVARKVGVNAPFEVHLVTTATAFIRAERTWTGRVKTLSIGIGMPLFVWLSEAELGAVIAHEFGHFIGGDTLLTPWVYRTRLSIGAAVHALDDSVFFLDEPFRRYGQWFLRRSTAVSRAQEYAADALSAQHFGVTCACAALEKIHLLEPMWFAYFHHDLVPALNCDVRLPVFDGYRRFCAASPKRREVQEAIDGAAARTSSPYDTHPSLDERMAALGGGACGRLSGPVTCAGLLGGEERLEAIWFERIGGRDWPGLGWDAFGDVVLGKKIQERYAGTDMAPDMLPLTRLPDIALSLDEWWMRLKPDGPSFLSPAGQRNYVLNVLRDWVIASLCHAGFALHVRPGESLVLKRDGITIEPGQLLAEACQGRLTAATVEAYMAPSRPDTAPVS